MGKKYLIAICDILGFSNLVRTQNLSKIRTEYFQYLKGSLELAMKRTNYSNDSPVNTDLKANDKLGFSWFSDTFLIYTLNDDEDSCLFLLQTIGLFIFMNMNNPNTRLRVGISYGDAIIDKSENIFIGIPIVEAHELEKKQKWSGGALTKAVEYRFGEYLNSLNPFESWVLKYDIPFEKKISENLFAINWTNGLHNFNNWRHFNWNKELVDPDIKEHFTHHDIVEKWENTKTFHTKVCWKCFPELKKMVR